MSRLPPGLRKFRAGILATGFAAAVFTGATYGAGLKTQKEWDEKRAEFRDSPLEEKVGVLQAQREQLVEQRDELKQKVRLFEERVKEREAEKAEKAARGGRG